MNSHIHHPVFVWLLIAMLLIPSGVLRAENITIGAGQSTGSATTLSASRPITFNFGVTTAGADVGVSIFDFAFTAQSGGSSVAPAVFRIWDGLGGTGNILATSTSAASLYRPNFTTVITTLASPVTLAAGAYSVSITTTAPGTGNDTWTWKNGPLRLSGTSGTPLGSLLYIEDSNTDGTAGTTLQTTQTVLAQPQANISALNFGAFRINASGTTVSAVLSNTALATSGTAPGTTNTQFLSSTGAATGAATLSGFNFAAGNAIGPLQSGTFTVGLSSDATQTVGIKSGTVTLTNQSIPGSSSTTGTTNLPPSTITVTGTGWQPAIASAGNVSLGWFHVGTTAEMATLTGTTQLQNTAPTTGFSEGLLVTGTAVAGNVSAVSVPASVITAGSSAQVVAGLSTIATTGVNSGTVTLNLVSSGEGTSGLANLDLANQTVTVTGTGYSGQSTWNTNGSGQWGSLSSNFGTNWQEFNGSPGLDGNFTNIDTATFGDAVTSGTATVTITSATPSVRALTFNNSGASYALAAASGGSLTLLNSGTNAATLSVAAGAHSMAVPVTFGSNVDLDIGTGALFTMSGGASGSKGLIKTSGGTLDLLGTNDYSGPTVVSAGALKVNGALTTSNVVTGTTATLMGSGTIRGTVDIQAGGRLSPGNSIAVLTTGSTSFADEAIFQYEVDSSANNLGLAADLLVVNGGLNIAAGTILEFSDLAEQSQAFADYTTVFAMINYTGAWDGGLFTYNGESLANLSRFFVGSQEWEINYAYQFDPISRSALQPLNFQSSHVSAEGTSTQTFVAITAVPEPSTLVLAIGSLVGLFGVARRRRRSSRRPQA